MPKAKPDFEISDAAEAELQAAMIRNPDSREASDEQLAAMRPASEMLPPSLLASLKHGGGRARKIPVRLRLDPYVVEVLRASGAGWQTRMNEVLGDAARSLDGLPHDAKDE